MQERTHRWVAETSDPLVVMRALAPVFHESVSVKWYLQTDGYTLQSDSTRIGSVKNLEQSSRRIPDSLKSISIQYQTPISLVMLLSRRPDCRFSLSAKTQYVYESEPKRVSLSLNMRGPDSDSIAGLMDRVKTQIESEFKRQSVREWDADPLPMPTLDSFVDQIKRHPWFVTIAGGLIVALLWLGIVTGWNHLPFW